MLFKSFTVMRFVDDDTRKIMFSPNLSEYVADKPVSNPSAGRWAVVGFSKPDHFGETIVYDCADGSRVLNVEFRERLLPSKVIKAEVKKRADEVVKLVKLAGRKLNRKEIAQLTDEVVNEMLPNAFIKVSHVLVMLKGDYMIIGSPVAINVDSVLALIHAAIHDRTVSFKPIKFDSVKWMTGQLMGSEDEHFGVGKSAVLKNGSSVVRVKDVGLQDSRIEEYLTEGFRVNELALKWGDDVEFTLNDKIVFRKVKLSDVMSMQQVDPEDAVDVFDADVALIGGTLVNLLNDLPADDADEEEEEEL